MFSLDGVIVPEETADVLLEAWEAEQQIAMEKDRSVSRTSRCGSVRSWECFVTNNLDLADMLVLLYYDVHTYTMYIYIVNV